ncbi:NAD(P)H-binding protein [Enterobacter sp. Bisph1]|uniref:NAD(P)H-binding protein n=1 Tax=Enterobacter sp. Bisph1 TaxID=1274399 RepID=UPI00057C0362|nr:NAD(P)H-binding protein [Enterobacter sp. Bisph1]
MTRVLILGAAGSLARVVTRYLLAHTDTHLTLYLRNAERLSFPDMSRVTIVEGDVMDSHRLEAAMEGQDVVCASLSGNIASQAENIIRAMKARHLNRLIFISSMGIYDEVPGENYGNELATYREAATVVEASGLEYTLLRPGWFTNGDEVNYTLTHKCEPFLGQSVSRLSIADLITRLVTTPELYVRESLGIARV